MFFDRLWDVKFYFFQFERNQRNPLCQKFWAVSNNTLWLMRFWSIFWVWNSSAVGRILDLLYITHSFHLAVPPSVPACRIQGSLDVGSDIMLFCSSEEGIPTPSYSWEKLEALPRLPHNAMQGITNKLAVGVPFCPTFAGKSYTHSRAQTQQQPHYLSHMSCTRPELLLTWRPTSLHPYPLWSCWGVMMDGCFKPCEFVNECVQPRQFCVCGIFIFFPLLSCWIPTYPHLFKANAMFLQWTFAVAVLPPLSIGSTCIQLHSERQKWVWFSALDNTDCPLLSSCAYCTVKNSSSSFTLLIVHYWAKKDW